MITTDDGFEIDPQGTMVYYYAPYHTDGFPSHTYLDFDNEEREWILPAQKHIYLKTRIPFFLKRDSVDEYIKSKKQIQ